MAPMEQQDPADRGPGAGPTYLGDEDRLAALAVRFEEQRRRLEAIGYRTLGDLASAQDAVQETWVRLQRLPAAEVAAIRNLPGWLTTVLGRVSLDLLRGRARRAESADAIELPDPAPAADPAGTAEQDDAVSSAMLVVMELLRPAERISFVLHDMFSVPFEEIGLVLDRPTATARQLASRGRRRVRGATTSSHDHAAQRAAVDAFLIAAREGRFEDLLAVLDPDVVMRADEIVVAASRRAAEQGAPQFADDLHGAEAVAAVFSGHAEEASRAEVDGTAGGAWAPNGIARSAFAFAFADGRITEVEIIGDPELLAATTVRLLPDPGP